jgi:Dna[CI] antecedent, DciA
MGDALQRLQKEHELRRVRRHQPQAIAGILAELTSRRGLARLRGQESLEQAWRKAIGTPGDRYTRVGALRRGVLEVLVTNSVLLQELAGFQKHSLLEKLRDALQSDKVNNLRFRLDG